jgi:hypothetical protein
MPANLPVGRDLTIRCKIENGWYYCAFGRSKAHHRIRAPALNPRDPEAAAEDTCGWQSADCVCDDDAARAILEPGPQADRACGHWSGVGRVR